MEQLIWIGLFLPLVGFLILLFGADYVSRRWAGIIACAMVLGSFICFGSYFLLFTQGAEDPQHYTLFRWVPIKGIDADFMLTLDSLSVLMTLVVTGVGFLIHVYSIGYMDHDKDVVRFFACMNFFVFSMLLLVLAGHLLVLYLGWESVGLASYLLIGFWYTRPAAAQAAFKAFVVNRIGDLGLFLGLLLTFHTFGTGDIEKVNALAVQQFAVGAPLMTILTLLYFTGAVGKSAQLPLHTWLPDAMEGPTPVSALIHAATMVTAGVYLVVRMHPVFLLSPTTLYVVAVIGAVTSLFAALCALGQTDLKRVLAYSTVSQLGLMFLACGVTAFYAAMFHLTMHAFVKALLFLSAGNVVHMFHEITDMGKMGGLRAIFTKTHWLFLIGVLALAGVPPLSAFFSKDLILEQDFLAGFYVLFVVGLVASILTGVYLIRAYCLAFTGAPRAEKSALDTVKEAPSVMLVPVAILAFLSIVGGFLGFSFSQTPLLESFLEKSDVTLFHKEAPLALLLSPETWLSVAGALAGIGVTAWIYTRYTDRLGKTVELLRRSFYIDEIYDAVIVSPFKWLANSIDKFFEPAIFNGSIDALVKGVQGTARWLQEMQNGQIRSYVAWMIIGTVLLLAYFAFQGA